MRASFADNMFSWEIVLGNMFTKNGRECLLYKDHSWPTVRTGSDDNAQSTGQLEWKGNSSTDHCNSPNRKLDQVARSFKRGLCLSIHGGLVGFQAGYQYEIFLRLRLACCFCPDSRNYPWPSDSPAPLPAASLYETHPHKGQQMIKLMSDSY